MELFVYPQIKCGSKKAKHWNIASHKNNADLKRKKELLSWEEKLNIK